MIQHRLYFPLVHRYPTHTESERLPDPKEPSFWRTFIPLLLRTGVTFGEAAALRWDDLDLENGPATVGTRYGVSTGIVDERLTNASRRTLILVAELLMASLS